MWTSWENLPPSTSFSSTTDMSCRWRQINGPEEVRRLVVSRRQAYYHHLRELKLTVSNRLRNTQGGGLQEV